MTHTAVATANLIVYVAAIKNYCVICSFIRFTAVDVVFYAIPEYFVEARLSLMTVRRVK